MNNARQAGARQVAQRGADRPPDDAQPPPDAAPQVNAPAPQAEDERDNPVQNLMRPPPQVPRPRPDLAGNEPNSVADIISTLKLLDRFEPEARDLDPALVQCHFDPQQIFNVLFRYYRFRFQDIALANDSPVGFNAQIIPCARRVAIVTINAITNKLIIANRTDGLPINNLPNPVGPPKGFLYPAVAAAVIAAVGKTSPIWSGDQYFTPDLNDAIPAFVDDQNNAVNNIHIFPAAPGADTVIARFCSAGSIPMRTTDWKIPGGTPHWLLVRENVNGRYTGSVHPDVHPDNFDPPNTLLAIMCSCTNLNPAQTRYIVMKSIAYTTVWTLVQQAYEQSSG